VNLLNPTRENPLAVLCVNVAGGKTWASRLSDPEAMYVIERCTKRIRRSVETHGGRLVDYQGSKQMAFFGNGSEAFKAAIEIHHRVADLPPHSGFPLTLGVGLCAGHQAREGRYFPADGDNPAARLSAVAQPGRIMISVPRRAKLFPWLELAGNRVPEVALNCGKRRLGVFQVHSQEAAQMAACLAMADAGDGAGRLCLRFQGVEQVLDESQPITRIGRLPDSDVIVRSARCSREHARIERRLDRFVYIDNSTNGTFVTHEKQAEVLVHRKEILLFGRGMLSFGGPALSKGAEVLRFQTMGLAD
jgi:class 3 adenylate cyclase